MSDEQEREQINKLHEIRINLEQGFVQTEFADGTIERYSYNSDGIFRSILQSGSLEAAARRLLATSQAEAEMVDQDEQQPPAAVQQEKSTARVLSGKLQDQPREGMPDGKGNPTAWAKFLAHIEGNAGAVLASATFHGSTRSIALGLPAGSPITAQGYYHEARGNGRNPTFSIFHLIN